MWRSGCRPLGFQNIGQLEHQANVFSATLLMPLDDFRRQVPERQKVDLDDMSGCADRYRVSLIAALLRWLEYTECRAVLVVSRERVHSVVEAEQVRRYERVPFSEPRRALSKFLQHRWRRARSVVEGDWASICRLVFGSTKRFAKCRRFRRSVRFRITLLMLSDDYEPRWQEEPVDEEDTYDRFVASR